MINEIEQQTLDIDWFFTNGNHIGFVASGGGKLPRSVALSSENNGLLTDFFRNLPERSGVEIAPGLNKIISPPVDERYLSSFVEMAEKGLFSFDKTLPGRFSDTAYHLVASPLNPLRFDELPSEIVEILLETKIEGDIQSMLNTELFNGY
jgi:hypothetical protein